MRVVVVDDHPLLRAGVAELLTAGGFEVVGQAGDAQGAIRLAREAQPDVVVLDIRMPPTHTLEGLDAARAIRSAHGDRIGILLLSHYVEARHAIDLLADGAAGIGYLLKDRVLDPAELADAVRRVGSGGSALDPIVVDHLLKRRRSDGPLAELTPREHDVLAAMAEGRSNRSIATALHISEKTVEAFTSRVFTKLRLEADPGEHRRVLAVLAYLRSAEKGIG